MYSGSHWRECDVSLHHLGPALTSGGQVVANTPASQFAVSTVPSIVARRRSIRGARTGWDQVSRKRTCGADWLRAARCVRWSSCAESTRTGWSMWHGCEQAGFEDSTFSTPSADAASELTVIL